MAEVDALLVRQGIALDGDAQERALGASPMPSLPDGRIPDPAPLPPGSRMPHAFNALFVGRKQALRDLAEMLGAHRTAAIGQVAAASGDEVLYTAP